MRKASERLDHSQHGSLPSNFEIQQAIGSFQKTFIPQHDELSRLQQGTACTVMQWLAAYSPYLTGPVMEGIAGAHTVINIHVSSETIEAVLASLQSRNLNTASCQRRLKLNNKVVFMPAICFQYLDFEVEVIVFSLRQQFQKPGGKSHNGSMRRMNLKTLQAMLG